MFKKLLSIVLISLSSLAFTLDWHTLQPIPETMDKVSAIDSSWAERYPLINQINAPDIGIPKSGTQLESNYAHAITNKFNINNEALTFILTTLGGDKEVATAAIKYVQYVQQFLFTSNQNNLLPYYKNLRVADSCIVLLKIRNHLKVSMVDMSLFNILERNTGYNNLFNEHLKLIKDTWPTYGYDFWQAKDTCFANNY